jgi:hypothetical protein
MRAVLRESAVVDDEDLVGPPDRGEAAGDQDGSPIRQQPT